MTPMEDVFQTLSATGIPGTRKAWPTGEAPALPWFTFSQRDGGSFHADDRNYAALPSVRVELYESWPDPETESLIESAIAELGPYERYDDWSPKEDCWITAYEFTYTRKDSHG